MCFFSLRDVRYCKKKNHLFIHTIAFIQNCVKMKETWHQKEFSEWEKKKQVTQWVLVNYLRQKLLFYKNNSHNHPNRCAYATRYTFTVPNELHMRTKEAKIWKMEQCLRILTSLLSLLCSFTPIQAASSPPVEPATLVSIFVILLAFASTVAPCAIAIHHFSLALHTPFVRFLSLFLG